MSDERADVLPDDLDENYARAGYGHRIGFGKSPALIIIDFVQAYMLADSPLYAGVEHTRKNAEILLRASRKSGIPILHTTVRFMPDGTDGGIFFRKVPALKVFCSDADPRFSKFADGLDPLPGEVLITKNYASAFFATSLAPTLTALGVDTLLISGVSTSGCVRATGLDACQHGFRSIVVREAVGDRDQSVHEANLYDLNAKYADVVSLQAVMDYLAERGRS